MKLNIIKEINPNIKNDEVNIIIRSSKSDNELKEIINYINNYDNKKVLVHQGYESFMINYENIMLFYSQDKNNYCKTYDNKIYKITSKLYELENIYNFIRISKKCIININYIKCFDTSQTGKIIVVLSDGSKENVSRRKIKDVLKFFNERII